MSRKTDQIIHIQTIGVRSPEEPLERCERTGKRKFPTRRKAEEAFDHYATVNSVGQEWVDSGLYQCEHCGGWHITRNVQGGEQPRGKRRGRRGRRRPRGLS